MAGESRKLWLIWVAKKKKFSQDITRSASPCLNVRLCIQWKRRTLRVKLTLRPKRSTAVLTVMNLECQGCDLLSNNHQRPKRKMKKMKTGHLATGENVYSISGPGSFSSWRLLSKIEKPWNSKQFSPSKITLNKYNKWTARSPGKVCLAFLFEAKFQNLCQHLLELVWNAKLMLHARP